MPPSRAASAASCQARSKSLMRRVRADVGAGPLDQPRRGGRVPLRSDGGELQRERGEQPALALARLGAVRVWNRPGWWTDRCAPGAWRAASRSTAISLDGRPGRPGSSRRKPRGGRRSRTGCGGGGHEGRQQERQAGGSQQHSGSVPHCILPGAPPEVQLPPFVPRVEREEPMRYVVPRAAAILVPGAHRLADRPCRVRRPPAGAVEDGPGHGCRGGDGPNPRPDGEGLHRHRGRPEA